jgi:predicted MFS family arabinose efflux permease
MRERQDRFYYALMLAGLVLGGYSVTVLAAVGAAIERDFQLSHTLFGGVQSAYFAANAAGSLVFTTALRRWRTRGTALAALGLLAAGNLLFAVPSYGVLLAGRMCMGLAISGMVLLGMTFAVQAPPSRHNALLNLVHGGIVGGACLGMLLTVPLARALGAWQRIPLLLAALTAVLFGGALLPRGGREEAQTAPASVSLAALLRHPFMKAAVFSLFGYIVAEAAVGSFYPLYAQTRGASPLAAANSVALFIASLAAGRFLVAWLAPLERTPALTCGLMAAGGACLVVAMCSPSPSAAVVWLVGGGALAGPTAPLIIGLTIRGVGHARQEILVLANLILCVGGAVGGILTGWWSDRLGLRIALLLSVAVFLAGLSVCRVWRRAPAA